jgi:hypothetical protein
VIANFGNVLHGFLVFLQLLSYRELKSLHGTKLAGRAFSAALSAVCGGDGDATLCDICSSNEGRFVFCGG